MTLLLYTTSARDNSAESAAFTELCARLDERYPLAFNVVATREPPQTPISTDRRDWVTLPGHNEPWSGADQAAARMLTAYAHQYRPAATVFMGSDAAVLCDTCHRLQNQEQEFGEEFVSAVPSGGEFDALFSILDRVLPISLVISGDTDLAEMAAALERHASGAGVLLYSASGPSQHSVAALKLAASKTSGPVTLEFGMKEIVRNIKRSLLGLTQLAALVDSRVHVNIVAESGLAIAATTVLTGLFTVARGFRKITA